MDSTIYLSILFVICFVYFVFGTKFVALGTYASELSEAARHAMRQRNRAIVSTCYWAALGLLIAADTVIKTAWPRPDVLPMSQGFTIILGVIIFAFIIFVIMGIVRIRDYQRRLEYVKQTEARLQTRE